MVLPARLAKRSTLLAAAGLFVLWLVVYLSTVSPTVNFIDSGELITALYEPGIAHPPGYPLYVLLGYVVSHLLPGEVAWRVNALSAFWGAAAVAMLFVLLVEIAAFARQVAERTRAALARPARKAKRTAATESDVAPPENERRAISPELFLAAAGASLFATSSSFWSRTAQAKMYTLHYFFVVFLLLAALKCRAAYERGDEKTASRWLVGTAFAFGLSMTNHLMTILLVPGLAVLLLAGTGWRSRLSAYLRRWYLVVPAAILPLLLYLYLPVRAAQSPVMNWGAPTTWDDFYRHISGWQYRAYLFADVGESLGRIYTYVAQQWWLLTPIVLVLAIGGAYLFAINSPIVFAATLVTAGMTLLFSLAYSISEIEPYMVPFYIMLIVLLTGGALTWYVNAAGTGTQSNVQQVQGRRQWLLAGTAALALMAMVGLVVQYPRQNHRDDRLAEQFVRNVFAELPQDSIVITDYWDFYAPTYYLQQVHGLRPDIAIVDKSLLRYPWYLEQLARRHPFLIEKSQDIAEQFASEQRKWVNDEPFDSNLLNNLYLGLLTSFVERNADTHQAFLLMLPPCHGVPAPTQCESNAIAPGYPRQVNGLTTRLLKPGLDNAPLPPEPDYTVAGIVGGKVPMDEFGRINSRLYAEAYMRLSQLYRAAGEPEGAARLAQKANEINLALDGQ